MPIEIFYLSKKLFYLFKKMKEEKRVCINLLNDSDKVQPNTT